MSANVVDLLERRTRRGDSALQFRTAADALSFAAQQVRDLERLAGSGLHLSMPGNSTSRSGKCTPY